MDHQPISPDAKSQSGVGRKERRQLKEQERIEELQPLQQRLMSDDRAVQLEAVTELRTLMEGAHAPPLDVVLKADFVPRLLQLSQDGERTTLQFEALWVLGDLTKGTAEQIQVIVDSAAVGLIVGLLASPVAKVSEQALVILGNIAGGSVELRNVVVKSDAVNSIAKMLNAGNAGDHQTFYDAAEKVWKLRKGGPDLPPSVPRTAARCISCLCQGETQPEFGESTKQLLKMLCALLMSDDREVISYVCSALANLQYSVADSELLAKDGVVVRLSDLLTHPSAEVQALAKKASEKIART